MSVTYTPELLAKLKKAYASGVLQVREGNDFVEYQTMSAMRLAIKDIEQELNQNNNSRGKASGSRIVRVNKSIF